MRSLVKALGATILVSGVVAGGCGGGSSGMGMLNGGGGATGTPQVTSGPYEPLAVGVSWTYHVNDQGVKYDKTSAVIGTEDAGGLHAGITVFHLVDTFPSDKQNTWYQVDGTVVKRLHDNDLDSAGNVKTDDWYDPFRLRVDETPEHLVAGATWSLTYTDAHTSATKPASMTSKTDAWRVDGVDEPITVPLGTFLSLHVTRTDSSDGSTKSFWFVRGVGKVREQTSNSHIEELASRTPAP
jgi:hypothetical protein